MKAISTHFHAKDDYIETCVAVFRIGKYRMLREFDCYRLQGEPWRLVKNDKEINT